MAGSIEVILNSRAGARRAGHAVEVIEKVFEQSGRAFNISVATGGELCRLTEKAASDSELLVAGGGDGTICCVAQVALRTGKTLGILPLGTFNYFARNLGIPLDLEAAARLILE